VEEVSGSDCIYGDYLSAASVEGLSAISYQLSDAGMAALRAADNMKVRARAPKHQMQESAARSAAPAKVLIADS
jgi:hypothetical protein